MDGYVQAVSRKLFRMLVMNYLHVSVLGSIVSYQRKSLTLAACLQPLHDTK